jgi:hypothetical protein
MEIAQLNLRCTERTPTVVAWDAADPGESEQHDEGQHTKLTTAKSHYTSELSHIYACINLYSIHTNLKK